MKINKLNKILENEIIPGFLGKFVHGNKMSLAFWNVKKNSFRKRNYSWLPREVCTRKQNEFSVLER